MAVNIVPRSVDQAITETVQKRVFVGENDVLLNPSLTPLFTLTTKIGNRKKTTASTRVEWIEDDYVSHWGQANGSGDYSAGATAITVVDGTLFAAGDLIAIPKAVSSSAVEEIARVTSVATNVLTVVRGIGGAGADTIPQTGDIRVLASAYAEGAAYGTPRSTTKNVKISYSQIFRRPVQITKSGVAQSIYGPANDRLFQRRKALEEIRKEFESAMLWSRPSENLSVGAPGTIRTTMGLKSRIATNITNANTTLTEGGLEAFAEQAFSKYFEGQEKLLLSSIRVMSALDYLALGHLRTTPSDDILGVKVKRYNTSHGDFMVARDLLLEFTPNSGIGWGSEAYAVDVDSIEWHPLAGNGENRDTQLLENVIRDGSDKYSDEYLAEAASVIRFEQRHARLYNVTAYA
jgi:Family of unknown function (DUF5309)